MNISCDMVIDLLSLYADGVASEDSRQAIREHLKTCPDCARLYRSYMMEMSSKSPQKCPPPNGRAGDKYTDLARTLRRRRLADAISFSSIVALSVGVGTVCLVKMLLAARNQRKQGEAGKSAVPPAKNWVVFSPALDFSPKIRYNGK